MTDQRQQDPDNRGMRRLERLCIAGLPGGTGLSALLQLARSNGWIGMEVQVKTVHLLPPDLFMTHRLQQQDLYSNAQQLLKLAVGPTRLRLTDQAFDGIAQRSFARKMDLPQGIQTEAVEQRRIPANVIAPVVVVTA